MSIPVLPGRASLSSSVSRPVGDVAAWDAHVGVFNEPCVNQSRDRDRDRQLTCTFFSKKSSVSACVRISWRANPLSENTAKQRRSSRTEYTGREGRPLFRLRYQFVEKLQREETSRKETMGDEQKIGVGFPAIATPGVTRVGWIGTGVMGRAMCGHLLDKGFQATVYNRTISKVEALRAKGAVVVETPQAVAERSDVVFTIVGYPSDVREVILGESGVLKGLRPGGVVVDMTTSEPTLARKIAEEAQKRGCFAVDAPVSGGDKGAKACTLAIMAGGEQEVVKALEPLFACMGKATYLGGAGCGQSCKLANQVTIASTMVGLVEGMLYAHRAGLDVTVFLQAIAGGAAGSKSLDLYASRIQKRDFDPGFFVNHFVKDLGIALEESQKMNLSLPGLALAQQLYVSLKAHGEGHLGTQALILALERLNNLQLPQLE